MTHDLKVSGSLGVGVDPTGPIDVVATDIRFLFQTNALFNHQRYSNTEAASPRYQQRRALGTDDTPLAVISGSILGRFESIGYGATGFLTGAGGELRLTSDETWTDSTGGTYLSLYTTPTTTVSRVERMRIESGGDVGVGTTNPTHRLHVTADGTATLRAVSTAEDNTNQFGNTAASSTGNYTYIQQRLNTSTQERTAMQIQTRLSDATDGTRTTETHFSVNDNGSFINAMEFNGTNVVIGNGSTDTLGFFGATGADREADFVGLTNSTGGTANNTLAACAACNNATVVNNNFSDVAAKINAIRDVLRAYNLMA